ncbi:SRPBCC family protein [Phytohabitans sp. LJ34]|uniref:SRPBCC family protein n=1 Tax=Phytohabitans sp. LJ34 TaxID=3452217 RepID=UPI003F8B33BD
MTEDLKAIRVDQFLPHPPAKVWRALTTPELMAQWLMPNDFRPEPGHRFTFRARPVGATGFSGVIACEVLEVTPPRRLRISWADAAHADAARTEVSWTLAAEGSGTRVLLEHSGFDPDDPTQQLARRLMGGGWRGRLRRALAAVLDA